MEMEVLQRGILGGRDLLEKKIIKLIYINMETFILGAFSANFRPVQYTGGCNFFLTVFHGLEKLYPVTSSWVVGWLVGLVL